MVKLEPVAHNLKLMKPPTKMNYSCFSALPDFQRKAYLKPLIIKSLTNLKCVKVAD